MNLEEIKKLYPLGEGTAGNAIHHLAAEVERLRAAMVTIRHIANDIRSTAKADLDDDMVTWAVDIIDTIDEAEDGEQ